MSPQGTGEVWWGREAESRGQPVIVDGPGLAGSQPQLLPASKEAVRAALQARISGFTPDWTNPAPDDSGVALVRLFGIQMEPLLGRVDRLPEKALVEYMRIAGVTPLPATAAQALLTFTVAPAAGGSVVVPAGFQAGASPAAAPAGPAGAGGNAPAPPFGGQVIFETERAVTATPATISALAVAVAGVVSAVDPALAGFTAFGSAPAPGNALWIGLALPQGVDSPAPSLSLALVPAATAGTPPPPVSAGGVPPPAAVPAPLVSWAILDGSAMVPATLLRDETGGLSSGGILELGVPTQWRPGYPPGSAGLPELLWLRALLEYGQYPSPPVFSAVLLNAARAPASRTIYDEPLVMLPDSPGGQTQAQLSQAPVVPGSIQLDVDADPGGDVFGTEPGTTTRWEEVDSLGGYGPDAQVFTVDYATGVVTFGDGVHGAQVPIGFRNVLATQYQTGGGSAGAVAANAVNAPLTSVGFVTAVSNPYPASGGTDTEPDSRAIMRGAQELRTGGRAVTPADYGVLAVNAPGALVARAQGVAGLHPDYPGTPIPGVVGVLCVAPDTGSGLPPVPGEDDLQAVTVFLTTQAAPAGVLVAAAAVGFHLVKVEAWVVLDPGQDQADLLGAAGAALDGYLHPLTGGDAGTGWPFGGPLQHVALVRRLLLVAGVLAVPQLAVVLDGVRYSPCTDVPIPANSLVWPDGHQLLPVPEGGP
jgi:predicted phage baseplate assembly protein